MFFARCAISLIIISIGQNAVVWSAPVLDGSAAVENQAVGVYSKIEIAPANENGREEAVLESEGPISSVLAVYDKHQKKVTDLLETKPLVDTINEHEKYGNEGDQFYGIGRAIVNGFEHFANIMNKLLNAPAQTTKTISTGITAHLNRLGAKIVGLA